MKEKCRYSFPFTADIAILYVMTMRIQKAIQKTKKGKYICLR